MKTGARVQSERQFLILENTEIFGALNARSKSQILFKNRTLGVIRHRSDI